MKVSLVRIGLSLVVGFSLIAHAGVARAACGPGGCGGTVPKDPGPKGPLDPVEPPPELTNRHAVVWQGFEHGWEHEAHRMGDFKNLVVGLGHTATSSQVQVSATRLATFLPGQDGDEGDVVTFARSAVAAGLKTYQGAWALDLEDVADMTREDGLATTGWEGTLTIDVGATGMTFDQYAVVLRGIDMDMTKADGTTGYVWPTVLDVNIGVCARSGGVLSCLVAVELAREDSPDGKETEAEMRYHLTIPYSVVMGVGQTLKLGPARNHAVAARDYFDGAEERLVIEPGLDPSYGVAVTAITGYRFELFSDEQEDGRYLHELDFHVEDVGYNQAQGTLTSVASFGLRRSDPAWAVPAEFDATLRTRVLLIGASGACAEAQTRVVTDHVCKDSTWSWIYMGACADPKTSVENDFTTTLPGGCL